MYIKLYVQTKCYGTAVVGEISLGGKIGDNATEKVIFNINFEGRVPILSIFITLIF